MAYYCDLCSGPCGHETHDSCCWARAMAIKKFKSTVLHKYIFEVLFDVIVSVASVITDLLSLYMYIKKKHWVLAVITAIPVLLPTIVFTNVYLADETKGYCKMPNKKRPPSTTDDLESASTSSVISSAIEHTNDDPTRSQMKDLRSKLDFHCSSCRFCCYSCLGFWGGIYHSIFHKDRQIRKRGFQMVRKSIKRLSKYFFGTFVLRFIGLAWYSKALMFGIKAYKEPKKYMKIATPNTHWSYELLVRLDFLQAALENAPQCIIQLYVLLTYSDENVFIGISTLIFSFMDFIRVSISVQWDIHRGPVIAPSGCYGSITWKLVNMLSWIFLYVGRSAALALVIATAMDWTITIPVVILVFHVILFAKLFSKAKFGVAAQKVMVSVFISIFFLPEFDSIESIVLTQFYYAVVHIQNIFFIIPWNGLEFQYCFHVKHSKPVISPVIGPTPKLNDSTNFLQQFFGSENHQLKTLDEEGVTADECLIDPTIIILTVPALTMIGIVMRLAASKKMADYKKTIPNRIDSMKMEERIATIYNKKWTSMTFEAMSKAFLRMLKKEVISVDDENAKTEGKKEITNEDGNNVYFISSTLNKEFKASQNFIRETISLLAVPGDGPFEKTQRSMSMDAYGINFRGKKSPNIIDRCDEDKSFLDTSVGIQRSKSHDDVTFSKNMDQIVSLTEENVAEPNKEFEIEVLRVDCPEGPYFLEMSWI